LPVIRVPLLPADYDVSLDLQPIVDEAYSLGRYYVDIDYTATLIPPLSDDDAAWLRERLEQRE
jgi:hypothetical protein